MKNFANKNKYPHFMTCEEYSKQLARNNLENRCDIPMELVYHSADTVADHSYLKGLKKDCEFYDIKLSVVSHGSGMGSVTIDKSFTNTPFLISSSFNKYADIWNQMDVDQKKLHECDMDCYFGNMIYDMPCTAEGVLQYIDSTGFNYTGQDICVVGRGDVGYPLATNLIKYYDCTVTVCNSHTMNLYEKLNNADLVILAIDKTNQFNWRGLSTPVLDVGIGMGSDGKLHGAVDENTIDNCIDFCATGTRTFGLITREILIGRVIDYYNSRELVF